MRVLYFYRRELHAFDYKGDVRPRLCGAGGQLCCFIHLTSRPSLRMSRCLSKLRLIPNQPTERERETLLIFALPGPSHADCQAHAVSVHVDRSPRSIIRELLLCLSPGG